MNVAANVVNATTSNTNRLNTFTVSTNEIDAKTVNSTQVNTDSITARAAVNATQINTASLTASDAVNATQINTASLTASNAVNATQINTASLTASNAVNSQKVNAENVKSTTVDAKAVNATQVNTDSITARAAVNATQINTASLTASDAVNATQINTASLTASDAVNATQINTASLTASNAVNSQKVNAENVKSTTVDAKAVNATQVNTDSITAKAAVNATQINTASLTASDAVNATQVNTASLTASNAVNATKVNAEKVNTNYLAASGIIDAARVRTGSLAASGVIDAARIRTGSLSASGIVDAARVRTESLAVSGVLDANRIRTASFSSNTVNTDNLHVVNTINVADGPKISSNGITNLAAGDISEFSTDAINGGQLYQILVSNALLYYPNIAPSELVSNTGLTSETENTEAAPRSSRSRRSLDSFEDFSADPELMTMTVDPVNLVLESVDSATAEAFLETSAVVSTADIATSARVNADQIVAGTTDVARVNVDQINGGTGNISRVNADQIVGGTGNISNVNADLLVAGTGNISNVNTDLLVAGTGNIARVNTDQIIAGSSEIARIDSNVMNANQAIATTSLGVTNGPELTAAGIDAADKVISNVTAGTNSTDAVNKAQLDEKADKSTAYTFNVSNNEAALSSDALADTWTLEQGDSLTFGATSDLNVTTDGQGKVVYGLSDEVKSKIDTAAAANKGVNVSTKAADGKVTTHNVKSGETVAVHSGKNIAITQNANTITVATIDNPTFAKVTADSVSVKNGPTIDSNGINMNNKRITNVADGVEAGDAVNVRQLNQTRNDFDKRLNRLNKDRKAGTASAIATAGLLQAPAGQSGVTAAVGQYESQSAVAVGYSQSLPSGVGVKVSFSANTRKELGGSVGMGYFW
ncbi:YadA family autotransporter adhesin [Actinobacillus suis]|uniref:YadA family autotransporter adhesin n=1 Tax=Actinobacillus suis TaxID=716 RepID=UPI0004E7C999|nr:YadA-like family protein [Actinobacillus suis]AIJ31684.1 extracellular matrix protein adhesin A [Actinobacillus suis ATCC 33415]SNV35455.1 extracellular matrix protein adhesin A [Actinobacillus suis]